MLSGASPIYPVGGVKEIWRGQSRPDPFALGRVSRRSMRTTQWLIKSFSTPLEGLSYTIWNSAQSCHHECRAAMPCGQDKNWAPNGEWSQKGGRPGTRKLDQPAVMRLWIDPMYLHYCRRCNRQQFISKRAQVDWLGLSLPGHDRSRILFGNPGGKGEESAGSRQKGE
jgi:hypothetical protein